MPAYSPLLYILTRLPVVIYPRCLPLGGCSHPGHMWWRLAVYDFLVRGRWFYDSWRTEDLVCDIRLHILFVVLAEEKTSRGLRFSTCHLAES